MDEIADEDFLKMAARVPVGDTSMYAVWVDGRDLAYHNFECILPLDRALHRLESGNCLSSLLFFSFLSFCLL